MTPTNGAPGGELGQAVQDVAERAQLLVREEIELAKAEVTEKVGKLVRGSVIGIAAGVFAIAGILYLGHAAAWGIWELFGLERDFWVGFLIVAVVLFIFAAIAGLVASRLFKNAQPPKPEMAIEEAHRVRDTVAAAQKAELGEGR